MLGCGELPVQVPPRMRVETQLRNIDNVPASCQILLRTALQAFLHAVYKACKSDGGVQGGASLVLATAWWSLGKEIGMEFCHDIGIVQTD